MKVGKANVVRSAYCVGGGKATHYALRTIVLAGLLLLATAVTHAHADLLAAMPAPGSLVSNPVGQIQLTFSEPVAAESEILLFGDDFQPVAGVVAQLDSADPAMMVAAVPELEAGMYTVQWTAVSSDGHSISGSYAFRVSATSLPIVPRQLWLLGVGLLFISAMVILWRRKAVNSKQ